VSSSGVSRLLRALLALSAGGASAIAVAACGQTAVAVAHRDLSIALLEYRLRPDHIVARAGALTLAVSNDGRLVHNLLISRPAPVRTVFTTATGTRAGTTSVAASTPDLAPGQSATITVKLTPGRYPLTSNVGSDAILGARGTLTVLAR
jgi:uncharacterized cupredoxin-like copper-binding protein